MSSPLGITSQDEHDALSSISQMLVGSKVLQDEPGVIYSLSAMKANPADAQALDQFMQGLDAEKQVYLARAASQKIALNDAQKGLLNQLGVNYQDVQWTQQDTANTAAQQILDESKGKFTAKTNADGTLALDKNGQIQVKSTQHHDDGGFGSGFLGLGPVWHGFKHYVWDDVLAKAGNALMKPINLISYQIGALGNGDFGGGSAADDQAMRAMGYDPNSFWSNLAWESSGKAVSGKQIAKLNQQYGADKVDQALTYLNDPKATLQSIENDPNSYATTVDNQKVLTPQATAQLNYYNSNEFKTLARRVGASNESWGNLVANDLGIDPVNHPDLYNLTAAGSNIAASFFIDPTLAVAKLGKAVQFKRIGINTLADSDGAVRVLEGNNTVTRGWQRGIDLGEQIRQARDAGEADQVTALSARFRAELPGLAGIMDDFVGGPHGLVGWSEATADGKKMAEPVFGETDGIRSLEDAQKYVGDKLGLLRLMNGGAARQQSLMPGALSAFGAKKLKGVVAEWMTTRSLDRLSTAYQKVYDRAAADPALAQKLIDDGALAKMSPSAVDAVDFHSGAVLADGDTYKLTPAGRGDVQSNLRATGNPVGDGGRLAAYTSPVAIAERARLAATRLSTLLPRNTLIDINDARSSETIYQFARTYLGRGDAQALHASWQLGNAGQRKAIVGALIDQVGHAAGLGRSATGQAILNRAKTAQESYSAAGSEITLADQPMALFEGQTRDQWMLPSFQAIQQASRKVGLWEATMGRAMTAQQADRLMGQWKMGALFKPSTVTRNQLEGWLRTALEGRVGDALKARAYATTRNKELWRMGYAQDSLKEYETAVEAGDLKLAKQIENGSMLGGDVLGRSKLGTKVADFAPFALAGRGYRYLVGKTMDQETLDALATLGPEELAEFMEGYGQQLLQSEMGFRGAAVEAAKVAHAGYGPATMRMAVARAVERGKRSEAAAKGAEVKYTHEATTGTEGVDRYETALAQRVNAMPETAKAVLDYIEHPESHSLDDVVAALDKESKNTAYGRVTFDDPLNEPNIARQAVTPDEAATGKRDWAQKVVDEYVYLLSGQNGVFQTKIADYIREHGEAPSGSWIADHITGDNRPETVLAPQVMAMPNGGVRSIPATLQDVEGGAYQWLVERPLQRTTSSPVFMANYAIVRKAMNPTIDKLVDMGISREAAENMAKELSVKNAWVKTEQLIDDPGQKTQFDVIARNMFPFARATNAMIRRWGSGLWQNPQNARKLMLAYEGAEHAGFIYQNAYGEPSFTYPVSGVANMAMRALSEIPGFGNLNYFPVSADMTGGVLLSVPGADNPFRMSMGPMLTMPLRELYKNVFPSSWRGPLEKTDAAINGPVGVGETWPQLLPTVARHFYENISADDRNSALASSTKAAIQYLAAAGLVPPPDASPQVLQLFRSRVQTQVHNQLWVRFTFGLFAPAAPSQPTEVGPTGGADFAWQLAGVRDLSDEYKSILNDVGGDVGRANAVFTALHPDQLVYNTKTGKVADFAPTASAFETGGSKSLAAGSSLPSTDAALGWMETHSDFIHQFGNVAAYFIPEAATQGNFSDAAYRMQIELGLRQRKTPEEFMNDVYVRHAEATFYPTVAQFNAQIAQAKANGDTASEQQWMAQKSQWEKEFEDLNPMFHKKIQSYADARSTALDQLANLRQMVQDGRTPANLGPELAMLIANYDGLVQYNSMSGPRTTEEKSAALNMFNQWAEAHIANTPLADLFNGVFRALNTNLTQL